jgi:hypothetical protein
MNLLDDWCGALSCVSVIARLLPIEQNTDIEKTRTYVHAPDGNRIHDSDVLLVEDSTPLGLRGHFGRYIED